MDLFPLKTHEFNSICYSNLDLNENINMEDIINTKHIDFNSIKIEKNDYELKNKDTSFYINKAKEESENVFIDVKDKTEIELIKKIPINECKKLTKEEKKNRRRLKNCISARKVQLKKKKYIELLENYIVHLENEHNALLN